MVEIWRIFNKNEFKDELNRCCWDDVTSPNLNTDISVCNFYNKVEKLLDEMSPIQKLTRKEIGLQERPWINHDILVAMSERNKLHKTILLKNKMIFYAKKCM